MATLPDPAASLKRKASRWQMLPTPNDSGKDIEDASGRYSLMFFLRDLDLGQNTWQEFIDGLNNAPGSLDENSTMSAILAAALETQQIQYDYIDPAAPASKKRRLDLYGNQAAAYQIAEYDGLVSAARTMWKDPNDLSNFLGKAYRDNLRRLAGEEDYSIENVFDYARSWSEVRYRFMNHALRDDPTLNNKYSSGRVNMKGNAANTIVHESNLLLDARMVEFQLVRNIGYNPQDREIFQELYLLTPEEGRQLLRYTSNSTGLRIGLPQVFRYCVQYINAYMNWRVRVLESARRQVLGSPAFKNAGTGQNKQNVRDTANQRSLDSLSPADEEYGTFISQLRTLLNEAQTRNAFLRTSYDELEATVGRLTQAIRTSVMNKNAPELQYNMKFQNEMRVFPGFRGVNLTRPTGTSIIAPPRRRP
ncbi:hypothetical protein CHU98_g996 [Xylaria longipes]|nr:hypothetical protein CHU98_g996 [Xylaria longipes]